MTFFSRFPAAALATACLLVPSLAAAQPNGTVAGLWNVVVVSPEGEATASLAIAEDGGRVAGLLSGARGQVPVEGTSTSDALTLRFSVMYEGMPLPITLTAAPTGDTLSGQADYAGQATGTWKATRATANGVNGVWSFSADAGDGAIPGALVLLDENGTVYGRLVVRSRGVDGRVTGTQQNGALALKAEATVDGSPVTIDMPGKVDGAGLSGTFSVGDIFGRWSAARP